MFSALVQRLFFRGTKSVSRSNKDIWLKRAKRQGNCSLGFLPRGDGRLSYLKISSGPESSGNCVIFCHPISKKGKYFFTETNRAQSYMDEGFLVYSFDFNGFGDSNSIDLFYWQDVVAVIRYVMSEHQPSKVILHGASFGAFQLLRAMPHLPLKSVVVLENVNKSLISYWCRWWHAALAVKCLQFLKVKSILHMDAYQVAKSFSRHDLTLHFMACELDSLTTVAEMKELFSWFDTEKKTFTLFIGAMHLAAPVKNLPLYKQVIFDERSSLC